MKREPRRIIEPVNEMQISGGQEIEYLIKDQIKQIIVISKQKVSPDQHYHIIGCEKTEIVIEGRFKSLLVENCKKTKLTVTGVLQNA